MNDIQEKLKIKRAYEQADESDGKRILVDRLWPRGIKKENLDLTAWWKDIAPSSELRKWFGHDPEKYEEFREKYRQELDQSDAMKAHLTELTAILQDSPVTFIFGAKDTERNNAAVLQKWVCEQIRISDSRTSDSQASDSQISDPWVSDFPPSDSQEAGSQPFDLQTPDYLYNPDLCPCTRGPQVGCPRYKDCGPCQEFHHSSKQTPLTFCERKWEKEKKAREQK